LRPDPGDNFETLLDFFKGDRTLALLTWDKLVKSGQVNEEGIVEGEGLDYKTFAEVLHQWKAIELAQLKTDLAIGILFGSTASGQQGATGFFGKLWGRISGVFRKGTPITENSISNLQTLRITGELLKMIESGRGEQVTAIMLEMSKTSAGKTALQEIHMTVSRMIPHATDAAAAGRLKTLQDISRGLF
jgi:hypothetical protein